MTETYREIRAERGREREGWNANFCCLSPAAGRAVWHVWWMVLHWYCCPLTSAHCHQSRNKREEKQEEEEEKKNPAARAVDASFHHHTEIYVAHTHTHSSSSLPAQTHGDRHQSTHTHTHPDNLYLTAVCICWAKLISLCLLLTSPRSLHRPTPPPSDATITHLHPGRGFWERADKQVHHRKKLHTCCTFRAEVGNEEEVDECTLVNSWK